MTNCWRLRIGSYGGLSSPGMGSYIGGKPTLPHGTDIPECTLCGSMQSFFFQIAFPDGHKWSGLTLAVFMCTHCVDEQHLIPVMLSAPLHGTDIPEGFLEKYQKNFRFIAFESAKGEVRNDYMVRVKYRPLCLEAIEQLDSAASKVGGAPNWILEDESPGSYAGSYKMSFLFQLAAGTKFEVEDSAPPQVGLGLTGAPHVSRNPYYSLFNGNALFVFGVCDRSTPLVYALTQI